MAGRSTGSIANGWLRVTPSGELDAAMSTLFATDGPALLCVHQDAELL